ncbi:nucleoside-diphosphate-sugar epimerase [Acetobacter nitrogenifigens DSM 23921 = NBRC 105050]|uniref:Putative NAD-dependent epimerase/dehydratase n=1 Tax=Acetobacter nitrogenifigens DSM 23921 = NBRC 105050 TaxID=1120919 RepID=A0A511XES5_9PROT|nr:SDR family oxidoreductase [Acetobacter nitrogenifigens]GBQ99717.1 nucleoside-diphosphate-sugar epimerase [Acetobacter nitrogenifigens DSM 23921 = NBRC 105050]GEN61454.1 putative NAD-dependent epimerase/dehydratase [Acetobacter nitrogenifigens DSM 23921 = NBRC 105050]
MRVFVTGATGFIGSAVVRELLRSGHEVTGLVRSAAAAAKLEAAGAKPLPGGIEDLECLAKAASQADGVIHTAFFHSFSQARPGTRLSVLFGGSPTNIVTRFMNAAVEADRRAIETLGQALLRNDRRLVIAFPTMAMAQGRMAVETDTANPGAVGGLRARCEAAALELAARNVRTTIVRLPPSVHDQTRQGLVTQLIAIARKKQISACVGGGANRWAAVHRLDAAHLFHLALEQGEAGRRYHAVAENGIPFRDIAEAIGRHLSVPVRQISRKDASKHFGWLAPFVAADNPVSNVATQSLLNWRPSHPTLMEDLDAMPPGVTAGSRPPPN